jgi:serine/threonine protein kinase
LKYLKNHKIIHRDIKPENILLDEDMKIKISDFGWSIKSDSNFRKTFCGTYDYLCPEMIKNRPYDNSIDIWSLGILTYELACGRAPFTQS